MSPGPGTVIADRYELGALLGRGGMAEVYAGTDRRLRREVAVKLLRGEMAARPDIRTRFEAEARAAASFSHPNAVAVFDTGEHDGTPYIVMERLPGETLADHMAPGPVDPQWLGTVAVEVLGALGAAHAAGLVHRDVKPANILIAADGRAKVADFGIAKSLEAGHDDLTGTGQVLGTPAYLAPERLEGAPASVGADLWALGVVLYEALAAAKPFTGDTPLAMARSVVGGTHRSLAEARPDLDPALVHTVEKAMAHDPAQRFRSATEMAAALAVSPVADTVDVATTVGDTQVFETGPPPGPVAPATGDVRARPGGAKRRRLVLAAAILGAIALLVVLLLARSDTGGPSTHVANPGSTPSTTAAAAPADSPASALAQHLRDAADGLSPSDGRLAATLATRLRDLADRVDAGGGGSEATGLFAATIGWGRAGQLTPGATASVAALLEAVPGIDLAVVSALTHTQAPTVPATTARSGGNRGKGKSKD